MNAFDSIRQAIREAAEEPDTNFSVTKSNDEHRYTFGVMYVPGAVDHDGEYVEADDLQKAVWDYMRKGYRGVRDTHTNVEIGELVELVTWPYPVEVEARTGDGALHKMKLPENTVFAGVVWNEDAWQHVKSGRLRGYSMGGRAVRVKDAAEDGTLPKMTDFIVEGG